MPPRAVTRRWVVGLYDCDSLRDPGFYLLSCCCPTVAWGCLYDSAFRNDCKGSCWLTLLMMTLLYKIVGIYRNQGALAKGGKHESEKEDKYLAVLLGVLSCTLLIVTIIIRCRIRRKYQIPGNCFQDSMCMFWCGCCSAIQAYQHMERSHENPRLCPIYERQATLTV